MILNNRSSKNKNLKNPMVEKSNINITKDIDHDEIFERLYDNNLNQCDGDEKVTYKICLLTLKQSNNRLKKRLVKKKRNKGKINELI